MKEKLEDLADVVMEWTVLLMVLIGIPTLFACAVGLAFAVYAEMRENNLDRGFCLHERETRVTRLVGKTTVLGNEMRCVEWQFPEGRP